MRLFRVLRFVVATTDKRVQRDLSLHLSRGPGNAELILALHRQLCRIRAEHGNTSLRLLRLSLDRVCLLD